MAVLGSEEPDPAPKKRKRDSDDAKRKLLVNERVEVRSVEDGFKGSWHSGIVVAPEEKRLRHVSYDHLLADDESGPLVEAVSVSPVLDGDSHHHHHNHHRGNIRPLPLWVPVRNWDLHYGLCVEAEYQDAWWEGVVLDHEDGLTERRVFFPDLGDVLVVGIDSLRVTRDWDESTGEWDRRGSWLLFELIEDFEQSCGDVLPVSVTQIWYDVRQKRDFEQVREWTRWDQRDLWKKMVSEVCLLYLKFFAEELCRRVKLGSLVPVDSHSKEALGSVITQVSHDVKSSESVDTKRWQLATSDMVPRPEFHPEAVGKYVQCSNGDLKGSKIRLSVQKDLWKHLLYLGWKIEYSYEDRIPRKRYTQPGGGKCLYSLIQVCKHLAKSAGDEPRRLDGSLPLEQPQEGPQPVVQKPSSIEEVRPDSCSGPILEYCRVQGQKVDHGTLMSLRLKVQEQLLAEGWMISSNYQKSKGRNILMFRSPTGKALYSVISACKYYLDEMPKSAYSANKNRTLIRFTIGKKCLSANNAESIDASDIGNPKVKGIEKPHKNRDCSVLGFGTHVFESHIGKLQNGLVKNGKQKQARERNPGCPKPKIRKTSRAFVNVKKDEHIDERVACVLRSSKCVQEVDVPNSSHGNPRSILSWLIDNNVLLPRSKVCYINETENLIMGEGRVTRSGIKCGCCSKLFALSDFAVHAGGKRSKAVANIFLEDGRSILDCQKLVISRLKKQSFMTESCDRIKSSWRPGENDYICSVCHYGGELMLCDQCPSSFHKSCLGLKDVPEGDWFCPSCCCGVCGEGKFLKDKEHTKDGNILTCSQCAHKYHIGCLKKKHQAKKNSNSAGYWFCDKICKKIYKKLQKLLGKWTTLGAHNLTWSLLKSTKTDSCSTVSDEIDAVQKYCKLNVALGVMHECFKPVKESHTQRDLMEDVIFSRESELQRLNFQGFYTVVLARNDELISVASVRVHGKKVAEVPLVGTRFQYRRLGMCRILMNELEKKLMEIGVERLVLPAVPSVLNTWTTSFGFSQMTASERLHFLDFTFLDFQDTIMCQKLLTKIPMPELNPLKVDAIQPGYCGLNGDIDQPSADSEVYQVEQAENVQIACQEQPENYAGHRTDTESCSANVLLAGSQPQNSESRSCVGVTETDRDFSGDLGNRLYSVNFFSKCYKRRKHQDQD